MSKYSSPSVTPFATALWVAAGVLSGLLAESLREREARRLETALRLAQARAAHVAQEEIAELHRALERSLLPSQPPRHPDLRIVTAYRPGERRLQLGGDFFDVLSLADGDLALIIGDVVGHGPEAAALGARLRAAWQALTLSDADIAATATSLNEMVALSGAEEFVTACLARLKPSRQEGRFLSAGHPPPLLLAGEAAAVE
jgi:serine phosphatase RsbU (regulator of sigma subunit)